MSSLSIHRSVALAVLSLSASAFHAAAWAEGRVTTAFDANWRFQQADAKDAQAPTFNDAKWGALSTPRATLGTGFDDAAIVTLGDAVLAIDAAK
jgi:hypothetical protein